MKAFVVTAVIAALAASVQGALHPAFPIEYCTSAGCTAKATSIALDKDFAVTDESQYPANGVTIKGNSMQLALKGGQGPRVYLAASDDAYEMIKMVGKELTYDVDTSGLTCNMNGALYFVQMPQTGAKNGTGYCDANGVGGTYCPEMDIWEANKYANAFTTHASAHDSSGCGYNNYKFGKTTLYGYGAGFSVDTSKPFSVVTQFLADSAAAKVQEIRRIYLQNGKVIQGGSMDVRKCDVAAMGAAMQGGSVLAMSIWSGAMWWLDSGKNGPCPTGTDGTDAVVTFSNIRVGDIGTTAPGTNQTPAPTSLPPVPRYGQCGGAEYDGSTVCAEGTCTKYSDYYWQCA